MTGDTIYPQRSILGAFLVDGEAAYDQAIKEGLSGEDFTEASLREIFRRAADLKGRDAFVGPQALIAEIVGGKADPLTPHAVFELGVDAPQGLFPIYIPKLVKELKRNTLRRKISSLAEKLKVAAAEGDEDRMGQLRREIAEKQAEGKPFATWSQTAALSSEWADEVIAGKTEAEDQSTIPWPWPAFNSRLKTMRRGELVVVGGAPSQGKSSFMRQAIRHAASSGFNTLIVSLEVTIGQVFKDMASELSGLAGWKLSKLHKAEQPEYQKAIKSIGELPIELLEVDALPKILSWIEAQHAKRFVDLIAIDYLGLVAECHPARGENSAQAIGQVAAAFKKVAKDLGCVVLLGAQINRDAAKTERPPQLHELKGSGDIEAHADRVLLLHRPTEDKSTKPAVRQNLHSPVEDRPRFYTEIFQEKGRTTGTGAIDLWFNRELTRFEQIVRVEKPAPKAKTEAPKEEDLPY